MADDPNPALRAELVAALSVIAPQIRGLHDMLGVSISAALIAEVHAQITVRERRRDLIQGVLNELDQAIDARAALEADGYPALDADMVPDTLIAELQEEVSDIQSAASIFKLDKASTLSIGLGNPVEKT